MTMLARKVLISGSGCSGISAAILFSKYVYGGVCRIWPIIRGLLNKIK